MPTYKIIVDMENTYNTRITMCSIFAIMNAKHTTSKRAKQAAGRVKMHLLTALGLSLKKLASFIVALQAWNYAYTVILTSHRGRQKYLYDSGHAE